MLLVNGCVRESIKPKEVEHFYQYYPLQVGDSIEYYVDSTSYLPVKMGKDTTISYHLLEVIDSPFTDNEGDKAFKVFRFIRYDSLEPWELKDVWSTKVKDTKGIRTEENRAIVKLVFPIEKGHQWDGLALTDSNKTKIKFTYPDTATHKGWKNHFYHFDSTTVVNELYIKNGVDHRQSYTRYATNVGIVYSEKIDTNHRTFVNNKYVNSGVWIRQSVTKFSRK